MTRNLVASIALSLLLISAGCLGPDTTLNWDLSVNGHEEKIGDKYRFDGWIDLSGHVKDVTVHDVSVIFIGQDGSTLARKHVGRLNQTRSAISLNITLEQPIQYVVLSVGAIDSPGDADCGFMGLEKTNGELYPTSMSHLPNRGTIPDHPCRGN